MGVRGGGGVVNRLHTHTHTHRQSYGMPYRMVIWILNLNLNSDTPNDIISPGAGRVRMGEKSHALLNDVPRKSGLAKPVIYLGGYI